MIEVNLFAKHLKNNFSPNTSIERIKLSSFILKNFHDLIFNTRDIKNYIKSITPNVANGIDTKTNKMVLELPSKGVKVILFICNASTRLKWKVSLTENCNQERAFIKLPSVELKLVLTF